MNDATRAPQRSRLSRWSHVAIGCAVLYYVLKLSHGDRGPIDWVIIGLVGGAILKSLSNALGFKTKPG